MGRRSKIFLASLLGSAFGARLQEAEAAPPPRKANEPPTGLLESYSSYPERTDPEAIALLGRRRHWSAAERLVLMSRDLELRSNPRAALALVRALHAHARGPERERVTRALLSFFRSARAKEPSDWGALARRVRGTAALALAANAHPAALRELIVLARAGSDFDPELRSLARDALAAHPIPLSALGELGLPAAPPPEAPSSPRLELTPNSLSGATSDAELTRLLEGFAEAPCDASTFEDEAAWRAALTTERAAWALRALTLVGLRCAGPRELARREAERLLTHASPSARAAAAQTRAIFEPDEALVYLRGEDLILRRAALAQSHDGALGEEARRRALSLLGKGEIESTDELAWFMGLDVDRPPSAALLRAPAREPRAARLTRGLLAAHARDGEERYSGPSFEKAELWLDKSDALERSAVARGLGVARGARAIGLLLEAYDDEPDPTVRRSILAALGRRRAVVPPRVFEAARDLDPDPACRALALHALSLGGDEAWSLPATATRPYHFEIAPEARLDPEGGAHLLLWSTVDGRTIPVLAAPDGFALVTGLPFLRPRNPEDAPASGAPLGP